jgi:hypothetical protein
MMIMKSTMCVNWTAASVSSSGNSRGTAGVAAEGGAASRRAGGNADKGMNRERERGRQRRTGGDNGLAVN